MRITYAKQRECKDRQILFPFGKEDDGKGMGMDMQGRRAVVTGIGVIASNGTGKREFFENSLRGKSGLKKCTLFDAGRLRTEYVGQIDESGFPYLTEKPSDKERICYIMEKALDEAFSDAGLTPEDISGYEEKAYLAFATSLASNGRMIKYISDEREGKNEPEWLVQIPSFVPWIKKRCGIKGGCYTTMAACAAGTTAAGIAYDLIRTGKADFVVCGGADPLTEFSCKGFNVLKSLSGEQCRPFDKERDGINIGEGAAFFMVETLESARKRNARIYGEILGYGINNDAYHMTSPSPAGDGAIASMNMAAAHTDIGFGDISYINAHGTGTRLNDAMEVYAISQCFGEENRDLYVSTNKSMIGHCLAAAGAIEMASALLCLKNGKITPNIRIKNKMENCEKYNFPTEPIELEFFYALSNSYAFAGNTASILLGACDEE